jgi:hypothetical protein
MLKHAKLTPEQRLITLVALGTGLSAASFASLKRKAARAVEEQRRGCDQGAGAGASAKPYGNYK